MMTKSSDFSRYFKFFFNMSIQVFFFSAVDIPFIQWYPALKEVSPGQ